MANGRTRGIDFGGDPNVGGFLQGLLGTISQGVSEGRKLKQEEESAINRLRASRLFETQILSPLQTEQIAASKSERGIQERRFGVGGLEEQDLERKRTQDFISGVASLQKASSFGTEDLLFALPAIQDAQSKGIPISDIIKGTIKGRFHQ